jgi:hypothetical protein
LRRFWKATVTVTFPFILPPGVERKKWWRKFAWCFDWVVFRSDQVKKSVRFN